MDSKVIVSNRSVLVAKYGSKGLLKINKALDKLKAADKKRGLNTQVIFLDDKVALKKMKGVAVTSAANPKENKLAIDAIFKMLSPSYLMILGASDVVPQQNLDNTMFKPGADDDPIAWSDLPYACNATYSRNPRKFIAPARVVGRLPDLPAATDPAYLIGLLATAANYQSRSLDEYESYFGLSTFSWKKSTP